MSVRVLSLPPMSELRSFGEPRVHPNGFIQLDLDEANRLHVWHPNLPFRQKTFHPVHDHVFDFQSHIYSGRLVHVEYHLKHVPPKWNSLHRSHVIHRAECVGGSETVLRPVARQEVRIDLVQDSAQSFQAGQSYSFLSYHFHESLANVPTMTIMTKSGAALNKGANSEGASIAVPQGVEPDNDFRRDHDPDILWTLIEEAYPS
ncbi:MAG: hypothetical protein V3S55_15260 [Nitrospiraceae bacterium]